MQKLLAISMMCLPMSFVTAQAAQDPIAIAKAEGLCVPFGVADAHFDAAGILQITCEDDATALVPFLGGLAPLLGAGSVAALAAAVAGGNSTPDTQ